MAPRNQLRLVVPRFNTPESTATNFINFNSTRRDGLAKFATDMRDAIASRRLVITQYPVIPCQRGLPPPGQPDSLTKIHRPRIRAGDKQKQTASWLAGWNAE